MIVLFGKGKPFEVQKHNSEEPQMFKILGDYRLSIIESMVAVHLHVSVISAARMIGGAPIIAKVSHFMDPLNFTELLRTCFRTADIVVS